jgi:hypothetical protein
MRPPQGIAGTAQLLSPWDSLSSSKFSGLVCMADPLQEGERDCKAFESQSWSLVNTLLPSSIAPSRFQSQL